MESTVLSGLPTSPQDIGPSLKLYDTSSDVVALTALGSTVLVAWLDPNGTVVTRPAASTSGPSPIDVGVTTQFRGSMIFDGVNYLAAWRESPIDAEPSSDEIVAGRITPSGQPLDGAGIVIADQATDLIGIFRGNTTHLILWDVVSASLGDPASVVFTLNGTLIGDDGRIVSASIPLLSSTASVRLTTAVWNGSFFLVTWFTDALYGIRVGPDGTPLDAVPTRLLEYPLQSGVYANGKYAYAGIVNDSVLVFVLDDQFELTNVTIVDRPQAGTGSLAGVDVATDGDDDFVIWWRMLPTDPQQFVIGGQDVTHEGNLFGSAAGIGGGPLWYAVSPPAHVVWSGRAYDVAWNTNDSQTAHLKRWWFAAGGMSLGTVDLATVSYSPFPGVAPFLSNAPAAVIYARTGSTGEYKNVWRLFFQPVVPLRGRSVGGE